MTTKILTLEEAKLQQGFHQYKNGDYDYKDAEGKWHFIPKKRNNK